MKKKDGINWDLTGWWFFVICAVLYIISGINARDPFSLLGSVFFLAGCVAFLFPYYHKRRGGEGEDEE